MEKVLLDEKELQFIKKLQQQEQDILTQLGQIEYQILAFNIEKDKLKTSIKSIGEEGIKFSENLQQKYGDGNINIETGEFTKTN